MPQKRKCIPEAGTIITTDIIGAACAVEKDYKLTEKGLYVMKNELGIRLDMDLRSAGENPAQTDALGSEIAHIYYGVIQYSAIFEPAGKEAIGRVFSDLAVAENYPIYLHCTYGADRTGTVCYLLGALLGVPEDALRREYEATALYHKWCDSENYDQMVAGLRAYAGETLSLKAANYLAECGVTAEELEAIRAIYLY
ncbi:MAG: tyrosine-protein phosphatase [Clostridia bacterium]|nr:tyrosine-protein phosphatase [Clostridia bacterium]